jgi:hypothetical protein
MWSGAMNRISMIFLFSILPFSLLLNAEEETYNFYFQKSEGVEKVIQGGGPKAAVTKKEEKKPGAQRNAANKTLLSIPHFNIEPTSQWGIAIGLGMEQYKEAIGMGFGKTSRVIVETSYKAWQLLDLTIMAGYGKEKEIISNPSNGEYLGTKNKNNFRVAVFAGVSIIQLPLFFNQYLTFGGQLGVITQPNMPFFDMKGVWGPRIGLQIKKRLEFYVQGKIHMDDTTYGILDAGFKFNI